MIPVISIDSDVRRGGYRLIADIGSSTHVKRVIHDVDLGHLFVREDIRPLF